MLTKKLLQWAPFKIDAMGLVTLLGADEINRAVGRLSSSRITEFLPVMGSFVIYSDSFRFPIPGFISYNISDGICATDVTGWFGRWLLFQSLTYSTTTLTIDVLSSFNIPRHKVTLPVCLGTGIWMSLFLPPMFIGDWWGLANSISLGVSVFIRFAIAKSNRDALDKAAAGSLRQRQTLVKTLWKLPNGNSITIYTSRGVLTECLLTTPRIPSLKQYDRFRYIGWATFFTHIVSLGMATLPDQILTVSILAISTVCVASGVGSNNNLIGRRLRIRRTDHVDCGTSMASLFARLQLSSDEEDAMVSWGLMPLQKNDTWWRKYRDCSARNNVTAFSTWKERHTWAAYEV